MTNKINVLVLIVTYTCVVWCHMHEGMKHKGTGSNMNMTGGNNETDRTHGTDGTHGTGGTHGV